MCCFSVDLLDEKSYEIWENVLVYNTWYKTSTDLKPLRIWLGKIDGPARVLNGGIKH